MKKIIAIIFLGCFFSSCRTVVDFDVPEEAPRIVINGLFDYDSALQVRITKSQDILDDGEFKEISDASVTVYESGSLVTTLPYTKAGVYKSDFIPAPDKIYTLKVNAPGIGEAEATSEPVEPFNIIYSRIDTSRIYKNEYSEENYLLTIKIKDTPGTRNYYVIEGYILHYQLEKKEDGGYDTVSYYRYSVSLESADPLIQAEGDFYDGILFTDKLIDGKEHELKIYIPKWYVTRPNEGSYSVQENFILSFKTFKEPYFKYIESASLQSSTEGNPFAEPVQVYSNITNGFGIFAGYHEKIDTLKY